jgi:hypothetical protein
MPNTFSTDETESGVLSTAAINNLAVLIKLEQCAIVRAKRVQMQLLAPQSRAVTLDPVLITKRTESIANKGLYRKNKNEILFLL